MNSSSYDTVNGKVALITAGGSGIGRVIAEACLQSGYKVHVCDISEEHLSDFLEANPSATGSITDVSKVEQVEQLFTDLKNNYQRLDVLVNNAGIAGPTAAVEDISPEEWQQTINVDLNGQFYCTRLAVPMLKQNSKGAIINIASNAAFFGFPLRSPYTASKWALIGLTKTWAMELGPHNIRVNALCPGSVSGERIDNVIIRHAKELGVDTDKIRKSYALQSSMRLFVDAEDIANMVVFLSSDKGSSISGQAIGIDGHTENISTII
ncbi:MAG: SDR family oxidoreductase [Gammaproteobacteria bacterium]|nr:SDR family oxidoreductase [Gammaproteobacteria bacterium]